MGIFDRFYNIIKKLGRIEWNIHEQSFLGLLMIALAHQKLKLTNPVLCLREKNDDKITR